MKKIMIVALVFLLAIFLYIPNAVATNSCCEWRQFQGDGKESWVGAEDFTQGATGSCYFYHKKKWIWVYGILQGSTAKFGREECGDRGNPNCRLYCYNGNISSKNVVYFYPEEGEWVPAAWYFSCGKCE